MSREDFIEWIKYLGFSRTWSSDDNEYSIGSGGDGQWLISSKIYFVILESCDVSLRYSDITNQYLYGSNLLKFRLNELSDNGKSILVSTVIKYSNHSDKSKLYSVLRDLKLKNILKD